MVGAAPKGPASRQLAQECDALIASAVKRPYGWAWTSSADDAAAERKPPVAMRPPGSAAAGAVLLWAGALLEEPAYTEAAVHVARGIVASQASNGNVVTEPTFGPTPGKREPPAAVPDRAATRAGVALLLACVGADQSKDEMFRRAAMRAAAWLTKQQANDGGWPCAAPAGAGEKVPAKLIRLDERDVRDSTFALLLAASAADDRLAARAAQRSVEKLLSMRTSAPGRYNNLWSTFYRLNGELEDGLGDVPPGADVLASRRAIETLLAAALLTNDEPARIAAREAAQSLVALRDTQGRWTRLYVMSGDQPQPAAESIFGTASTQPSAELWRSGTFGIENVLAAADQLHQLGPEQMSTTLSETMTVQERLAATVLGLTDGPFAVDDPDLVDVGLLEGPPSENLDRRILRLYGLLLKARAEIKADNMRNP